MKDEHLIAWVDKKFSDAGFSKKLFKDGREWFISPHEEKPTFWFGIRLFRPDTKEQETDYLIAVDHRLTIRAETSNDVVRFFESVFHEGFRITKRHFRKIFYEEIVEIKRDREWEFFDRSWTTCWPRFKEEVATVTEYDAVLSYANNTK